MQIFKITDIVVPMRGTPSHRAEMINELLFGETFLIEEETENWLYINCIDYEYKGFIDKNANFSEIKDEELRNYKILKNTVFEETIQADNNKLYVKGSRLYHNNLPNDICFDPKTSISFKNIINDAQNYLNTPYRWGGRSPFGIDCSGFVQMVYMLSGYILPRDASEQSKIGSTISFISEAKPTDLVFFKNTDNEIIHTGILLSNNKIIHASGRVQIDPIDHHGIFSYKQNKYTHTLSTIKRISETTTKRLV